LNKIKKISFLIVFLELVVLALGNLFYINVNRTDGRLYRVEARRVAQQVVDEDSFDVDLSGYSSIIAVSQFDPEADFYYRNDYIVEKIDGRLIAVEYEPKADYSPLIVMNVSFALMILMTIAAFTYVDMKILRPFSNMERMTLELSKGNLATPLAAEKSKYFGKFLWGMDMLRESLEEKKEKEMAYQKEKKMLILSLSHDIKTPLSAIELYSKALQSGLYDTEEKKQEAILGIRNNTNLIKQYVNEITTASREDFLNLEVQMGECYLNEVMDFISTYYKDKLRTIHTDFKIEDVTNCILLGDKDRLIEVMQNVLENAVKYGDGDAISISFDEEEDCKLITVKNTGCTLPAEEVPHLFDSFFRGSNAKDIKGSGLGLYICKHLMKKMDGDVFAKVDDGCFAVTVVVRKAI